MDDISGNLGLSKKTLYNYFKDKEELVCEAMRCNQDGIINHFCEFENDTRNAIEQFLWHRKLLLEKLSKYNPTVEFDLRKYFPALYNDLKDFRRTHIYKAHTTNLEQGISEGLYRADINVHMVATMMMVNHIYTFDPNNGYFSVDEVFKNDFLMQFIIYHFYGICTPKGIEVMLQLKAQGLLDVNS